MESTLRDPEEAATKLHDRARVSQLMAEVTAGSDGEIGSRDAEAGEPVSPTAGDGELESSDECGTEGASPKAGQGEHGDIPAPPADAGSPFRADDEDDESATAVYDPAEHGDIPAPPADAGSPFRANDEDDESATAVYDPAEHGDIPAPLLDPNLLPSHHLSLGGAAASQPRFDWVLAGEIAALVALMAAVGVLVAIAWTG